jgi:hypothetical protein
MTDEVRIHAELLIAPNGDVYARLLCDGKAIGEKLVRRRSRPKQEAIDEGWKVAGEMFEAEMERRKQLPLFMRRVVDRNRKDRIRIKEGS